MAEITYGSEPVSESAPEPVSEPSPTTPNLRPDVEFKLPDGRLVRMGKPSIPSAMLLPSIIAGMSDKERPTDPMRSELNARMAIFVRAIDGAPFSPPTSAQEVGLILQRLGEDGCDLAMDVFVRHFAPLSADQLQVVKKS